MQHRGFYMNVSLKRTDRFQKSATSFSFCVSCYVAFVSTVLIWLQSLPLKPLYLCFNSAFCWQRIHLHLQVCLKHCWLSASINKNLQNCFEKVLKFWAMYYCYELGYYYYYYHLVPCNKQLLYSLLWDEGGGGIGQKNRHHILAKKKSPKNHHHILAINR